jgi:nucleotide-binding universal stress UspA family protein
MDSIVVGTDGSPNGEAAVKQATRIAKDRGGRLHLVSAFPEAPSFSESIASSAKRQPVNLREVAESVLGRAEAEAESQGVDVMTHARGGDPAQVLLQVAEEQQADLIVIGARGLTGFQRFLLGSVSSKLAHHAPCSLMIVRDRQAERA